MQLIAGARTADGDHSGVLVRSKDVVGHIDVGWSGSQGETDGEVDRFGISKDGLDFVDWDLGARNRLAVRRADARRVIIIVGAGIGFLCCRPKYNVV